MSTDGRTADAASTHALESADFVRLVTRADGDGLAASGILARALADRGTPFQVTVARTVQKRTDRIIDADRSGDVTLVVGSADGETARIGASDRPATLDAWELARELGATPDPVLGLAGLAAAGTDPGAGESEWLLEMAQERDLVDRRPGVVVPTADPIAGIAHSTRVLAPWSGDPDAARETLRAVLPAAAVADPDAGDADLDADDHRRIGSAVALDVVGAGEATATAGTAIQRALAPYATPSGPFATIGGYADVLEATARTEPGTGAALAMGHDAAEPACAAWRPYGRRAHNGLTAAETRRYDGLFVVDCDGPVEPIARLVAAYRSPEPIVLAVDTAVDDDRPREAALASREEPLAGTVEAIARELESETDRPVEYDAVRRRGYLRYDPGVDDETIVSTVRAFR